MPGLKTWSKGYPAGGMARRFYYFPEGDVTLAVRKQAGARLGVFWWTIFINGNVICESPDLHHAFRRFREKIAAERAKAYADVP